MMHSHQPHEQTPHGFCVLLSYFTRILFKPNYFQIPVKFVCFRHAREDGISTAQQFSAVSRESKDATEERTKPEAAMEETQEEDEEEQDTDSVEEDFYSCSEDE